MDAKEVIAKIREALGQFQASGHQFVWVPSLLQFLSDIERTAPEASEVRRLQHESTLEWYRSQQQIGVEMMRSVFDAAKAALTASILINGGATVALLAFVGSIVNHAGSNSVPSPVICGVVVFAFGVLAAAMASGGMYLTQYCYHRAWIRSGLGFHIASCFLVVASYLLFAVGVVTSAHAFSNHSY